MELSRSKRLTAGKAPPRFNQGAEQTPPPSAQSTKRNNTVSKAQKASRGSKSSKKPNTAAASEVNDRPMAAGTQPASLRREEDISTASPSPLPLLSDDALQALAESALLPQPEEIKLEEISEPPAELEYAPLNIEWSVILGRKSVYNTYIRSNLFRFEVYEQDAYRRAQMAADR
jgi:hypothetical protein